MSDPRESYKRPESVLVVVYTRAGEVLLLKRADHVNFWQSVTGAMNWDEQDPRVTAKREVAEEIGLTIALDALEDLRLVQHFSIFPQWRFRYAPDVRENTEHAFALCVPERFELAAHPEHTEYRWLPAPEAIALVSSWTNRAAIERALQIGPRA